LGLPKGSPPPAASPTPQSVALPLPGGADGASRAPGSAFLPAAPKAAMLLALESQQSLEAVQPSIPWAEKELQYLASQALLRVGKIDASKRATQAELEAQLRLLAAAPNRWPVVGRITSTFGWRPALFDTGKR